MGRLQDKTAIVTGAASGIGRASAELFAAEVQPNRLCPPDPSELARRLAAGTPAIIHVFQFPRVTINHGIVLYDVAETPSALRFAAYDPNVSSRPGSPMAGESTRR